MSLQTKTFSGGHLVINAVAPSADLFNGNPAGQIVSLSNYDNAVFLIVKGTGAAGTATVTVEATDDSVPTTVEAIPFRYRLNEVSDTWSDWIDAPAAGFEMPAGADKQALIEVRDRELPDDKPNLRIKLDEVVNDPVTGCVLCIMDRPNYMSEPMPSALAV